MVQLFNLIIFISRGVTRGSDKNYSRDIIEWLETHTVQLFCGHRSSFGPSGFNILESP